MITRTPSILITDDDHGFRSTLSEVFEPRGFRTLEAGNGEEALQLLEQEEVHLLVLDNHMPKLTGLETLRLVRRRRAWLPCILLSAEMDESIKRQARLVHAFSVLAKPVTRAEITTTVDEALLRTYAWGRKSAKGRGRNG